jgi:hypothetical protein
MNVVFLNTMYQLLCDFGVYTPFYTGGMKRLTRWCNSIKHELRKPVLQIYKVCLVSWVLKFEFRSRSGELEEMGYYI